MRDHLKLKTDDVMAIGDNWNDIEMFEQSGVSVAMGNAPDEVKQRASFITLSWEQSGVAHAFKSWGLTD
jgi:hydroxymethylpyrimidine pyrophosphatase-like HAD family hydrolase